MRTNVLSLFCQSSNRASATASAVVQLQSELEETKRELDLKMVENEGLQTDLQLSNQRFESSKAIQVGWIFMAVLLLLDRIRLKLKMDSNRIYFLMLLACLLLLPPSFLAPHTT